jgi:hypothetical protein
VHYDEVGNVAAVAVVGCYTSNEEDDYMQQSMDADDGARYDDG